MKTLDIFLSKRKELLAHRQLLLAAELELIALRRMDQKELQTLLNIPMRTIERHIAKLKDYFENKKSIPMNRVSDAIREAALLTNALAAAKIPAPPESVQTVNDADPSDLLFKLSEEELNGFRKCLLSFALSIDTYTADSAENDLKDIHDLEAEPDIAQCQKLMRLINNCYKYFNNLADYIYQYDKQRQSFIRRELRKSLDVKLFERYISFPHKGYPQIAAECHVSEYKLRDTVSKYEKKFREYRKTHRKK